MIEESLRFSESQRTNGTRNLFSTSVLQHSIISGTHWTSARRFFTARKKKNEIRGIRCGLQRRIIHYVSSLSPISSLSPSSPLASSPPSTCVDASKCSSPERKAMKFLFSHAPIQPIRIKTVPCGCSRTSAKTSRTSRNHCNSTQNPHETVRLSNETSLPRCPPPAGSKSPRF